MIAILGGGLAVLGGILLFGKKAAASKVPPTSAVATVPAYMVSASNFPASGEYVYWPAYPTSPNGTVGTAVYFATYSDFQAANAMITSTYSSG